jgi:hypothetical protein
MIKIEIEGATAHDVREQMLLLIGYGMQTLEATAPVDAPVTVPVVAPKVVGTTPTASVKAESRKSPPEPKASAPLAAAQPTDAGPSSPPTVSDAGAASPASVVSSGDDTGERTFDYDTEVKPAVLRLSQKLGRPGVEMLLKPFGVDNAKHVPEDKRGDLMAAIADMLAVA